MSKRSLALFAAVALVLAFFSAFVLDQHLAQAVRHWGIESASAIVYGREMLDVLTGSTVPGRYRGISNLLLGIGLVTIGLLWLVARRTSMGARALLFTGIVQLGTIEASSLLKGVFGRLRPYQLLEQNDWSHVWFAGGNSFPSGHVAFFWGLFLPLAYLYPKYRIALLVIPAFIAVARIDENVHFLSDVLGSIALAALVTLMAAVLFARWIHPLSMNDR